MKNITSKFSAKLELTFYALSQHFEAVKAAVRYMWPLQGSEDPLEVKSRECGVSLFTQEF